MPYPDRFYPVVDSVAWVKRLAQLGVGTIQLRAKDLTHAQAVAQGDLLLEPVYCLGLCASSPAMAVNQSVHARLTPARLDQIVNQRLGQAKASDATQVAEVTK